jgi:hypothetical protein
MVVQQAKVARVTLDIVVQQAKVARVTLDIVVQQAKVARVTLDIVVQPISVHASEAEQKQAGHQTGQLQSGAILTMGTRNDRCTRGAASAQRRVMLISNAAEATPHALTNRL